MLTTPAINAYAERQIARYSRNAERSGHRRFVGASEVGLCIRRIYYSKQQVQPIDKDPESWGASRRGNTFEEHFWVPAMREHYGKNLLYAGKNKQRSMIHGQLRATPDGLLINQPRKALGRLLINDIGKSGEIMLECKSIDPRINLSVPKPEHEFQAQVGLAHFRLGGKHKPDYAVISYTNVSFYDDCVEFPIKYDPSVYEQAKKRAAKVLAAKSAAEMEPEGWIGGGKECEYCPFATMCQRQRGDLPTQPTDAPKIDPVIANKIAALARMERQWHANAGAAEEKQRQFQHDIKELLRAIQLRQIFHDGMLVTWSSVKGRPSYDWPELRQAAIEIGLDIQAYETVGEPSDRLTITDKSKPKPQRPRGEANPELPKPSTSEQIHPQKEITNG